MRLFLSLYSGFFVCLCVRGRARSLLIISYIITLHWNAKLVFHTYIKHLLIHFFPFIFPSVVAFLLIRTRSSRSCSHFFPCTILLLLLCCCRCFFLNFVNALSFPWCAVDFVRVEIKWYLYRITWNTNFVQKCKFEMEICENLCISLF